MSHFNLISSVMMLYPNEVTFWNSGIRMSTHFFGGHNSVHDTPFALPSSLSRFPLQRILRDSRLCEQGSNWQAARTAISAEEKTVRMKLKKCWQHEALSPCVALNRGSETECVVFCLYFQTIKTVFSVVFILIY